MNCHLNLGSNLGDRLAVIDLAIRLIGERIALPGTLRVSTPVVSEPWGFQSDSLFINVGVQLVTSLSPLELLNKLNRIEQELGATPHRNADGTYCNRTLDIDIIHLGNLVISTPELTVPHPRMHLRNFVLIPLNELDPGWIHPILNLSTAQIMEKL